MGIINKLLLVSLVVVLVFSSLFSFSCVSTKTSPDFSLVVFITSPNNYTQFPINGLVPVSVRAYGDRPIQLIELLVDGNKVEEKHADSGRAFFNWKPSSKGSHILTAKAYDSTQKSRLSNGTTITISGEAEPARVAYSVKPGDTLANLAANYKITPEAIQAENPGLRSLNVGQKIFIPTGVCKSCRKTATAKPALSSQLQLLNRRLMLPKPISYGYAYLSFDNLNWQRVPSDTKSFLSPVNNSFDLSPFLYNESGQKSSKVYIEAWGWQDGKLADLGRTEAEMATTSLKICDLRVTGCTGEMAMWTDELSLAADEKNKTMELKWNTDVSGAEAGLVQISLFPFSSSTTPDSVYSKAVPLGYFDIDFGDPYGSKKQDKSFAFVKKIFSDKGSKDNFAGSIYKKIVPPPFLQYATYYVRVLPVKNNDIIDSPSNTVRINITPPQKSQPFELYTPPKALEVKIKEFRPLHYPEKGTCNHEVICETDAWVNIGSGLFFVKAGDTFCPMPYMGEGEESWFEQFCHFLTSGVAWVSEAYESLKKEVVSAVGSVVCKGDPDCEGWLAAGLEMGLVALGLPPSLPNFDELANQGLDYLAAKIAQQTGCPEALLGMAKDKLKEAIDTKSNLSGNWMDAQKAHDMGIEPFWIQPGAKAHWNPRATYYPARVTIEVRRRVDPSLDKDYETFKKNYGLVLSFPAINHSVQSGTITNIPPYNKSVTYQGPLSGALFATVYAQIPPLKPGESLTMPINLVAAEYWIPGHKEAMEGWTTTEYYDGCLRRSSAWDDWWILYWGGATMDISAVIKCYAGPDAGVAEIAKDEVKNIQLPPGESVTSSSYEQFIYTAP